VAGLEEVLRSGRPRVYGPEDVGAVIQAALTPPQDLGLPFASWTLDRLVAYLKEEKGVGMGRTRVAEVLSNEGLRWRKQEGWFGERVDPEFAEKRGPSSASTYPLLATHTESGCILRAWMRNEIRRKGSPSGWRGSIARPPIRYYGLIC